MWPWYLAWIKNRYTVVNWSLISWDFDKRIPIQESLDQMKRNLYPGAIYLFHDSEKASSRLSILLPELVTYLQKNDYTSRSIVL